MTQSSGLTTDAIKAQASSLGFALCGVSRAGAFPELRALREWIDRGCAGEMHYMRRTADRRGDVRRVLPSARTVVALATVYNVDRPYSTERAVSDQGHISRYAWGADYHTVVGRRTEQLLEWMRTTSSEAFEASAYVDTGPVQERVYAQHAGLGWIGKNTCLINAELGSWLFLSEIICSLPLEVDPPAVDQCGSCTLCLEACPTGAIVEPWVVDATRCVSYLTIELRGEIPEENRSDVGTHVYGCDICQDVCPWNSPAAISDDPAWLPVSVFDGPRLTDLWDESDEVLRPIIKHNAMSRAGVRRFRRNVAVALGNSGSTEAADALSVTENDGSRSDPLVVPHVEWARRRLRRTEDGRP
jgi:epoxyqueuosine reductase